MTTTHLSHHDEERRLTRNLYTTARDFLNRRVGFAELKTAVRALARFWGEEEGSEEEHLTK